jgi:uncharacterized metal-binding protein
MIYIIFLICAPLTYYTFCKGQETNNINYFAWAFMFGMYALSSGILSLFRLFGLV